MSMPVSNLNFLVVLFPILDTNKLERVASLVSEKSKQYESLARTVLFS